ncbi:MAG: T9SS type A sorting domain-containing protein, partial [Bacteroidetes bacterium]|nr:T9SS type A sorting domain-containing protein [Bacteroidota bacterium]
AGAGFVLHPNYPNPFNPQTTIRYTLAQPGAVTLRIYDVRGRLVRTLADARRPAGTYAVRWDGRDAQGQPVASGAYVYQLRAGTQQRTRQLVLVR